MRLDEVRSQIERMRDQAARQRREILRFQRAGIFTLSAEDLLQRMLDTIDGLCAERDRLKQFPRKEMSSGAELQRHDGASRVHQGPGRSPADRGA